MHFFTFDKVWTYTWSLFFLLLLCNCSNNKITTLNVVTPKDDIAIGRSIDKAFLIHLDNVHNQQHLKKEDHPDIYNYLQNICNKIQSSPEYSTLANEDRPLRQPILRILKSPNKAGAFIAPGGHIYIYTNFLKKLNHEAELVPILTHLLCCSIYRLDVLKLEEHFSTNFLLDLAIGAKINYNASATSIHAVINQLESVPYKKKDVSMVDKLVEKITCELGYDIQVYSTFFLQNSTQHLNWFNLFPRETANNTYAAHLFNRVSNSLTCGGTVSTASYPNFKTLIP